jgi:2-amino-4-hydroxy-6-hydroxymethyldihydropteridine diphosphokinase
MGTSYAIALGSNMRHPRYGGPAGVLAAAVRALDDDPCVVTAKSATVRSRPIGPSLRCFANAVVLIETTLEPPNLLQHLQALEAAFGRRKRGQSWRARVLDLDIILWSGGAWADDQLIIPHPAFRRRSFVLHPLKQVARDWRDPHSRRSVAHLAALLPKSSTF